MGYLVYTFVLFLATIRGNEGCTCFPGVHDQEKICSSGILLIVDILGENEVPTFPPDAISTPPVQRDVRRFTAKVLNIFGDSKGYKKGQTITVTTPYYGEHCGTDFSKTVYAITGTSVNLCSLHRRWNILSKAEKKRLKKIVRNCKCEVETCSEPAGFLCPQESSYCKHNKKKDTCQWKCVN